jgi:hypothetical protein
MKYQPIEGSLAHQVVSFFYNNPSEQLTRDDIAQKFSDAPANTVHTRLLEAREAGMLARSRNEDGDYIYEAGPSIDQYMPTIPLKRETIAGIKEFKIDKGIPLPRKRAGRNHSVWMPVLDALKEKGESVVVDKKEISNLQTIIARMQYQDAANQPKYVAGIDGHGHARVWRAA